MDKYRKVQKPRENLVKDEEEIRVTTIGSVSAYVSRAAKVFHELEKTQVVVKASGNALTKAVTLAEVIKRRFKGLHQITSLSSLEVVDEYEPLEEGLDQVTDTRTVSVIEIKLSKEPLDTTDKGYQPPIDESLVSDFDPELLSKPRGRGKGKGLGKGKGRGKGRGKGKFKGKGKYEEDYGDESLLKGKGKGKGKGEDESPVEKEKPNFEASGLLAMEDNSKNGVPLKFTRPPEARMPTMKWRLYIFTKQAEAPKIVHIHRMVGYLFGKDRRVADVPTDHPTCSKQHAVLHYRLAASGEVKPYVMDLESTNGTFLNGERIESARYFEMKERDVLKFGMSSREFVLLHSGSANDMPIDPKCLESDPEK